MTPAELDITEVLRENQRRARRFGRSLLLLVVSAEHCSGCETLGRQLRDPELRKLLAGRAYVVQVKAGDLRGEVARLLRIGSWTLESPGFPTTWVWSVDETALSAHAVAVGPLDEFRPDKDLQSLLDGRSTCVPEAAGVKLQACSGSICFPLDRSNDFQADFQVELPEP